MAQFGVLPSQRLLLQHITCSRGASNSAPVQSTVSIHRLQSARGTWRVQAVVTDETVPEGHKGLHGFLYGEQGAEVHEDGQDYTVREVQYPLQFATG